MVTIRVARSFARLDVHGHLHGKFGVIWLDDSATAECLAGLGRTHLSVNTGQAAITRRQIAAREHIAAGVCNCGFFGNYCTDYLPDRDSIHVGRWVAVAVCLLAGKVRRGSTGARSEFIDMETLYINCMEARRRPHHLYKLYQNWGERVRIIVVKHLPVMSFEPQLDGVKNVHNSSFGSHLMALRGIRGKNPKFFVTSVNHHLSRFTTARLTVAKLMLCEKDRSMLSRDEARGVAEALGISMALLLTVNGKRIALKRRGRRRGGIKLTEYQQQLIRAHVPATYAYVKGNRLGIAEGCRSNDLLELLQRAYASQKTTGQKASVNNLIEKLRLEMGVLA